MSAHTVFPLIIQPGKQSNNARHKRNYFDPLRSLPINSSTKLRKNKGLAKSSPSFDPQTELIKSSKLGSISKPISSKPKSLSDLGIQSSLSFILKIESNYGNPDIISLSEVDFLNKKKVPLNITKIISIHEKISESKLNSLINHDCIKNDISKIWTYKWSQNASPILLQFDIETIEPPSFLRIWNCDICPDSNVKAFSLYFHNQLVCEGILPQKFGQVLPIEIPYDFSVSIFTEKLNMVLDRIEGSNSNYNENELQPGSRSLEKSQSLYLQPKKLHHQPLFDNFGIVPIRFIKKVKIVVKETYDPTVMYTGLNCVEFFDYLGHMVQYSKIKEITSNTENFTSPYRLLKKERRTSNISEMWVAKLKHPLIIQFEFAEPIQIIMMRVWNFNGQSDQGAGIKHAIVSLDDSIVWYGKFCKSSGSSNILDTGVTDVWFCDSSLYKDLPSISTITSSRDE